MSLPIDVALLADALPQIVWMTDASGAVLYFNARWFAFTGTDRSASYGEAWVAVLHPDDRERTAARWAHSVATGEVYETEYRFRGADGSYRWQLARGLPVRDADGAIGRWFGTCTDIHDQKRAEETLLVLSRVNDVLNGGYDEAEMLARAARILVPTLAEWCFVFLQQPNSGVVLSTLVHADAEREALGHAFLRRYPIRAGYSSETVARTGQTLVLEGLDDAYYARYAEDERHLANLLDFDVRSAVIVPLRARENIFGALHFARTSASDPYDAADIRVIERLGKRFGVALENARNYARERTVAASFQRAALPKSLPEIPMLSLDAVYTAAAAESQVGGDWYDAFVLDDGRVAVSIGDVAGKGLDAAVVMSNMRQAIRVAAFRSLDPATTLAVAETALEREHPDRMVTAFVGFLDLQARTFVYACAGHPAPIVRTATGPVALDQAIAPPLGLSLAGALENREIAGLRDGTFLVFYTDGLIESTRDVLEGEERLLASLRGDAILHTAHPAAFVRDAVLHDGVRDDVAVLTLHLGERTHWSFEAPDAMAAQGARASFVRALRECGGPHADYGAAELIFGELVGNVVRHAPGKIEIDLDWTQDRPVLHVLDCGIAFDLAAVLPDDIMQETGRGLFLVAALGEEFEVEALPRRGNHIHVRLPIARAVDAPYTTR